MKYIGYVDHEYLQVISERTRPLKRMSYELMHIKEGDNVLDVGCGPAIDTIPLAQFVGQTGQVIGIDIDINMVNLANNIAIEQNVANRVIHKHFDAEEIPYNSDYFDSCHCDRLLQHLLYPVRTISEMVRVVKPGGWIVISDTDHSTLTIDTPDKDIEWKLRRFHTDMFKNGYIGRQLYRLLRQQNLADIKIELYPLFSTDYFLTRYMALLDKTENEAIANVIINSEDLKRWHNNLEKANNDGVFFASVIMMTIAGRKPWKVHMI